MKKAHPKTDLYLADREKGMTYQQIADKYGVSRQTVACCMGRRCVGHFRPFTKETCIYPNLRRWLNENKVSAREFARRMDSTGWGRNCSLVSCWFRGKNYPVKETIDRMLAVTGLTYEELFYREESHGER